MLFRAVANVYECKIWFQSSSGIRLLKALYNRQSNTTTLSFQVKSSFKTDGERKALRIYRAAGVEGDSSRRVWIADNSL